MLTKICYDGIICYAKNDQIKYEMLSTIIIQKLTDVRADHRTKNENTNLHRILPHSATKGTSNLRRGIGL